MKSKEKARFPGLTVIAILIEVAICGCILVVNNQEAFEPVVIAVTVIAATLFGTLFWHNHQVSGDIQQIRWYYDERIGQIGVVAIRGFLAASPEARIPMIPYVVMFTTVGLGSLAYTAINSRDVVKRLEATQLFWELRQGLANHAHEYNLELQHVLEIRVLGDGLKLNEYTPRSANNPEQ